MTKLTPEYFEDQKEQAAIETAITDAIGSIGEVYYHNLFIALSRYTQRIASAWTKSTYLERWTGKKDESEVKE